ncbi:MAG: methyltransferase domain-containing protein [Oscillospiraceae bacterium]|nr:methyltransferase domain-containing protein [Oscillospiraceae bacterium]
MSDWNSEQYLKFKTQRTMPAVDLASRVNIDAKNILDLGCGPGNSTAVLRRRCPNARILGIDSSPDMIQKARETHGDLDFMLFDASGGIDGLDDTYDVIFSNACIQWIPNHNALIKSMINKLIDGGMIAVQVPMNGNSPLFRGISRIASEPKWGFDKVKLAHNEILSPEEYYNILAENSSGFDIWETSYYHSMPSHRSLLEWVKSTRLKPYLENLNGENEKAAFEREVLDCAIAEYPVQNNGEIIFKFKRLFFTAVK